MKIWLEDVFGSSLELEMGLSTFPAILEKMKQVAQILGSLALVTLGFASPSCWAEGGILVIGDSLSVGRVAENVFAGLQKLEGSGKVRFVASCGSRPRDWTQGKANYQTNCGFYDVSQGQQIRVPYQSSKKNPQSTPKVSTLLAVEKPRTLVIQQGTNMFWDIENGKKSLSEARIEIRTMLDQVFSAKPAPKNCLWIAPPDTSKWSSEVEDKMYHFIHEAVGKRCRVFDSRKVTRYPVKAGQGADGIHYDQHRKGSSEQDKWAQAIVAEVASLEIKRSLRVDESSRSRIPTH